MYGIHTYVFSGVSIDMCLTVCAYICKFSVNLITIDVIPDICFQTWNSSKKVPVDKN